MIKKLILFLSGIILLGTTSVAIFLTANIYNSGRKRTVETYFFQPDKYSEYRPGQPLTQDDLGTERMRDMLIQRFITEYLYVLPDADNIMQRSAKFSPLYLMSSPSVFNHWQKEIAPVLLDMANTGKLRLVYVTEITPYGDYDEVKYELHTWSRPNDMSEAPQIEYKTVLLQINYEPGMKKLFEEEENQLQKRLDIGRDPVVAFVFTVDKIIEP